MDWLSFISKVIESIAWPATVAAVVFILRDSIEDLIKPLNKLKYGELEVEFGEEMQAVEKSANEKLPELQESSDQATVRERVIELIPISPKAAIIEAWRNLESTAIEASNIANIKLTDTALRKPIYIGGALYKNGIIDEESMQLFTKLRQLRNEAVHYEKMIVSPVEALSYINTSLRLAQSMKVNALTKKPHNNSY
jgi:hypothetical protein